MDITIKAENVDIDMKTGDIELNGINTADLIKEVILETGIDGLMDAVKESIIDSDVSELAGWLDINYDFNGLINELDDEERTGEILDQLIDDRD